MCWRGAKPIALEATATESGNALALPMPADITQEGQVQALFSHVEQRFVRLDLLFNNAGIFAPYALPSDVSGQAWRSVADIYLNAAFYCLSHAFALMKRQSPKVGRIINNGSISAHVPRPASIAYAATKHAASGLTKAANLDGRAFDIAVGQIDIGNVATDMTLKIAQGVHQTEARMDLSAVTQTFSPPQ